MQSVRELNEKLKSRRPVGRLVARTARALIMGKGRLDVAAQIAAQRGWVEASIIERAAVAAHTTTDTSTATGEVGNDLLELARAQTIVDRLQGFRRVPPRTNGVVSNVRAVGYWGSAQGHAIPASALNFSDAGRIEELRVGALAVITNELAESSSPAADEVVANALRDAVVRKLDSSFVDVENAGSPELEPASVTASCPSFASTGSTAALTTADLKLLAQSLVDGGSDLQNAVWVLHQRSAIHLASLADASAVFRNMGARGGELLGLPVIVSGSVPLRYSPDAATITLVDPSHVYLTDEGVAAITTSTKASVEMSNTPAGDSSTGTGAALVSLFQTDSTGIKCVRYMNWKVGRPNAAAAVLTGVEY